MKTPKEFAIAAVKMSRSNASDNLYRARSAAQRSDPNREWGESGQTLQSIIDDYQKWHDEATACLDWLEQLPEPTNKWDKMSDNQRLAASLPNKRLQPY